MAVKILFDISFLFGMMICVMAEITIQLSPARKQYIPPVMP